MSGSSSPPSMGIPGRWIKPQTNRMKWMKAFQEVLCRKNQCKKIQEPQNICGGINRATGLYHNAGAGLHGRQQVHPGSPRDRGSHHLRWNSTGCWSAANRNTRDEQMRMSRGVRRDEGGGCSGSSAYRLKCQQISDSKEIIWSVIKTFTSWETWQTLLFTCCRSHRAHKTLPQVHFGV